MLSAAFSPDGTHILTACEDAAARIWEAATGRLITALRSHAVLWRHNTAAVLSAVFSPDGARILTASDDCTARIWDAATGQEITRVTLDAAVTALAVHDGDIVLGDAVGRIHVFEAAEFIGGNSMAP